MLPTTNCRRIFLSCIVFLVFTLPALYPAQNSAAAGKTYKIVLSSGREISCSHYYERNGQIIAVRPFGEVTYSKEDVVEIREISATSSETSSGPRSTNSDPGNASSAESCKFPATHWFQAELRRLPRDAAAANTRIDELIAQEKARITELEGQLPALREEESAAHDENNSDRRKSGLTGEDVIVVSRQASGIATAGGAVRGTITFEDPTGYKRKSAENEIVRCQCNIFWAEKKRSDFKK
jgi:hypothetical protein